MAVLGILICHSALVAISPVGLPIRSSPMAMTTEASAKTSLVAATIAACICIHCGIGVAIGMTAVFCDCRSSCLLLDGRNNFFNHRFGCSANEHFDSPFE